MKETTPRVVRVRSGIRAGSLCAADVQVSKADIMACGAFIPDHDVCASIGEQVTHQLKQVDPGRCVAVSQS